MKFILLHFFKSLFSKQKHESGVWIIHSSINHGEFATGNSEEKPADFDSSKQNTLEHFVNYLLLR